MSITTPPTFPRVNQQDLLSARLESGPLDTILSRINYVWQHHRPPLITLAYLTGAQLGAAQVYEFGVEPSADGLLYEFIHRWYVTTAGSMSIKVEAYAGSWATIYGPTATVTAAGTWDRRVHSTVIAVAVTRLRVTLDHGVAEFTPAHLLCTPAPTTTPSTKQPSGYIAFDNGQYVTTGAPIHTEHLNRIKASCAAVLTDRKTMVLSLAQDLTAPWQYGQVTFVGVFSGVADMSVGRARCSLPGNSGKTAISLHFRGYTSKSPSTNYTATVRQVGATHSGSSVTFDLDGTVQTGTLTVIGETPEIDISVVNPDLAGTETAVIESLVGYWTPGG